MNLESFGSNTLVYARGAGIFVNTVTIVFACEWILKFRIKIRDETGGILRSTTIFYASSSEIEIKHTISINLEWKVDMPHSVDISRSQSDQGLSPFLSCCWMTVVSTPQTHTHTTFYCVRWFICAYFFECSWKRWSRKKLQITLFITDFWRCSLL